MKDCVMDILEKALNMLEKYPLCDHCLGRQFALLGREMKNDERGKTLKLALTLEAHALALSKNKEGVKHLKILAVNGFSETAKEILQKMKKHVPRKKFPATCFLCENKFERIDAIAKAALEKLEGYEYNSFLVGIELSVAVEEREDEFKAEFDVGYGENMRNEFGRFLGKKIADYSGKTVDYRKPDVVLLVNPILEEVRLQINPLYIAGRYKKLARGISQSKWLCASCRGKGCEKCGWTGKMYSESVEELIAKPVLDETEGAKASFHASGREDVDARMLGEGRPFVIEISKPKKRFLDLKKLEEAINAYAKGKVEVSKLHFADKAVVRKLKKAEHVQKEYRIIVEFENEISDEDMRLLEEKLTNVMVKQKTPLRVLHRRADLTREKYIYKVKAKKLSLKEAELRIHCQGGLYIKELVSGDEGRTTPSVSEILKNKAKPLKLDVLKVFMGD
ncbi:MAG: tRNA pseudouridine(54/55) synthase Pus10 [Candidatus Bathyarchaeia archaeon]